jgi:serine beta-lactamase-like protein LACTB
MAQRRFRWWWLIVLAPGGILVLVAGLWTFMAATATPIHPAVTDVRSEARAEPAAKWAEAVGNARNLVRANVVQQNWPGLSVAVGVGDDVVWAEGFGWADVENRVPSSPDMRYRIGGVSIALTSVAVGQLVEQGKLKLDDEIQTYVPAFPKKQWPVTLRQLMAHTAGIRGDGGDEEPLLDRCERTTDALKRFDGAKLRFEPGTAYSYTTYGWILVSAAVEAAAKKPFFAYMKSDVLLPLGIGDDTTPDLSIEPLPRIVAFYHPRFAGDSRYGPEPVRRGDFSCLAGGAGFLSTPSDLVRFGMAMDQGKLVQPETLKLLQTSQRLASGKETGHGLGWDLETVTLGGQSTPEIGHDGEFILGGSTSFVTFPDRHIVVAMTTNISFAKLEPIARQVAEFFVVR